MSDRSPAERRWPRLWGSRKGAPRTPEASLYGSSITQADRVRRLVTDLELPSPFDAVALCQEVGRRRGRLIDIRTYPPHVVTEARRSGEPLPYGMWLAGERTDYIFHRSDTSAAHQQRIILHELGHIILGHRTGHVPPHGDIDESCLDREVISTAAKRTDSFGARQEAAAELFADLIEHRSGLGALLRDEQPDNPRFASQADRYTILEG